MNLVQMVLETKAGLEAGVVGAGHRFAAKRLDAQRSTAGWVGEQMGGLAYLGHIRELAKRVDADWAGVQARPWERHACLQDVMRLAVLTQCPPPSAESLQRRACLEVAPCPVGVP